MCPHHIITVTAFIVQALALKAEGSVCPHHIITACIVHAYTFEAEGACVSTPYHYSLHGSRTRFRSRGNLCVHTILLQPSLFTHTL